MSNTQVIFQLQNTNQGMVLIKLLLYKKKRKKSELVYDAEFNLEKLLSCLIELGTGIAF